MTTSSSASQPTAPGEVQVRRALLSVSDKRGLADFARGLAELGVEIVSTGGTAGELEAEGIPIRSVESYTGFPEILDGRVKTLHPRIHAGLLAVRSSEEHVDTLNEHEIEPIDLVCVNLYPFERVSSKRGVGAQRGDREHRRRRAHADQGRGQEPRLRGGGGLARELRRGARGAAPERRAAVRSHPREPRPRGLRLHGALRHRHLPLVRRARGRLPRAAHHLVREGARPSLRREPPPAGRLLRRGGIANPPALDGLQAARQGAVVQQPARRGLRPPAGGRVRAARGGDHQAQQPLRRGRGRPPGRRLRARAGHGSPERLRRRLLLQPAGGAGAGRAPQLDVRGAGAGPRASTTTRSRCCRPSPTSACSRTRSAGARPSASTT